MQELRIEKVNSKIYEQCIICSKVANKQGSMEEEKIVGDLYRVCLGNIYNTLCRDCLQKLRNMINNTLDTQVKFNPGDRVYHRNLEMYGTFIEYAWESDGECDVKFEEDGLEQRHVSVNWLELVDEI